MRVLIDGIPLLVRSGGVKSYVHYWLLHLRKIATSNESIAVFPFLDDFGDLQHEGSSLPRLPTLARLAFLYLTNWRNSPVMNLLGKKIDVFHNSNVHVRNLPTNSRVSATLHDVTCLVVPETHERANLEASRRFLETVPARCDGLLAVSESTRNDAIQLLGLRPERIRVNYPGVPDAFFSVRAEEASAVVERYKLKRPYVLFVGVIEPRKNLDLLIEAFANLREPLRETFDLVVAGPLGWAKNGTIDRLKTSSVRYLGYVPEADLPGLTAGATVFAYPSLYEGFGLPVAQAMACGVPVVTSNVSALPEVASGAALLVDPRSVAELGAALERALESPEVRARLAANGRVRAQLYRWDLSAQRSLEFFRELTGQ